MIFSVERNWKENSSREKEVFSNNDPPEFESISSDSCLVRRGLIKSSFQGHINRILCFCPLEETGRKVIRGKKEFSRIIVMILPRDSCLVREEWGRK